MALGKRPEGATTQWASMRASIFPVWDFLATYVGGALQIPKIPQFW